MDYYEGAKVTECVTERNQLIANDVGHENPRITWLQSYKQLLENL